MEVWGWSVGRELVVIGMEVRDWLSPDESGTVLRALRENRQGYVPRADKQVMGERVGKGGRRE